MRDALPEFYPPAIPAVDFVTGATVVLDSNVLLSLYRWSPATRKEAIVVLEAVADRLWFPYQVGKEYLSNREEVAKSLDGQYSKALSAITEARKSIVRHFESGKRYQVSRERVEQVVGKALDDLRAEVEALKEEDDAQVDHEDDAILVLIERLARDRIGERPKPEVHRERVREFLEHRLPLQIPPGYADANKGGAAAAGDYLIWCEILEHASKHSGTPVLFVTDDVKSDWYEGTRGARTGPRRELVAEFAHYSGTGYHQMAFDRFLELAKEHLNISVAEETVNEVRTDAEERHIAAERSAVAALRRDLSGVGSLPQLNINRLLEVPAMHAHLDVMGQALARNPNLNDALRRAAGLDGFRIDPQIFSGLKVLSDEATSNIARALRAASRGGGFDEDDADAVDESPTFDDDREGDGEDE